ncbi:centromere/kinetochore protein zw10 [Mayamaea pseudoterrestris]|nr:centromere/kinetochore protein zw10 [Mayamaea pseudoterrestris]
MNNVSTIQEETTVESRLLAVQRSVRRMTLEAFQQSRATNLYIDEDPTTRPAPNVTDPNRPGLELELFGQEASVIEQHVSKKLQQVESELEDVMADFKDVAATPEPAFQTPEQLDQEAALLKTKISFLKSCSRARANLDECTATVVSGPELVAASHQLVEALQALKEAQDTLQSYENEEDHVHDREFYAMEAVNDENITNVHSSEKQYFVSEASKMLTALQSTARRQKVQLLGRAKTLWHASVELTPNSLAVRDSKPATESSDLSAAYDTFLAFGENEEREVDTILRAFTRSLHESVFAPLLTKHEKGVAVGEWTFDEMEERNRAKTISVVTTSAATKGPTRRLEWTCDTEDEPTIELSTEGMDAVKAWKETFSFIDRILTFFVERILLHRQDLCQWAGKRFYGIPEPLFPTLNLVALGLESRRLGDDNGLLMQPLVDALTESCALYRTARELLDLFRAIIPSTHGYEIKNVPRTAAVFHNDCVFLAHHCLTLGLEYQDKYPAVSSDDAKGKLLRQSCMFIDMVPLFRDLAECSLGDMLDLQASQLAELVGQRIPILGDSLRSNDIVTEWSEAETALTAGVYHLRHLKQSWQPVLSTTILICSMWYLCDVVFTLFLDQVLAAKDISTSACQFVSALLQRAGDEIVGLVDGKTKESRVWDRFTAVRKFMDMNLNDIQLGLTDGVFQSITGQELTRLILATFGDSPKRREITNMLLSH